MEFLRQMNTFATVNREEDLLSSQVTFLGQDQEASVRIQAGIHDFIILHADFEISRGKGVPESAGSVSQLRGLSAGFEGGGFMQGLRKLNRHPAFPMLQPLFIECIHGVTQAETYVIKERGFAGEKDYEDYWWQREKDGCLFYSGPRKDDTEGWFGHLGPYRRSRNLFNRNRHISLERDEALVYGRGFLTDSYHTMNASIVYDEASGIISACRISPVRVPALACREMEGFGQRFVGQGAYAISGNEITQRAGGSFGCFHLSGLMRDLFRLIQDGRERKD